MSDYYNGTNIEMKLYLMFLIMIENSRFCDYFYPLIPNDYKTENDFCLFFATEKIRNRSNPRIDSS